MTAQEAVELIHQEAWTGHQPGLDRTIDLLGRLGDPHKSLKFVHITGTNGKGSTACVVASVLGKSGLKTGLYTSPHLWHFCERFRINGVMMPDERLVELTEQVIAAGRAMEEHPTEFELMTAIGMLYFKEEGCDLVVLEVGLGGRLDSTNVIPAPEVAAIVNIGLEHIQELGDTLEKIAAEKSGIIKPGSSVVLYHQTPGVEAVVERACRQAGASLVITATDTLQVLASSRDGQTFLYRGKEYHIGLLGDYQVYNATTAIEIVEALRRRGWNIPEQAMEDGLAQAIWPARMELAGRDPDIVLDGGHNPQCMQALSRSLTKLYPGKRIWFLTGVLADKDFKEMFRHILPITHGFVTITPDSPRAMTAQELADYLRANAAQAIPCGSTQEGIQRVLEQAGPEDVICISGSLYMIGEVRHLLGLC